MNALVAVGTPEKMTPTVRPTVILCVACASSFSFLLGYDIGIFSGDKHHSACHIICKCS